MKGLKPFPSLAFVVLLSILMTACGGSTPKSGAAALYVATTMLPGAVQGIPYNQTLTTTGGVSPFFWTVQAGTLPAGLTLTAGGLITGIPTTPKTSNFTVQVTDSQTPVAAVAKQGLSIIVNAPLGIGTASLPTNPVNIPYPDTTLMATGGLAPFTWSVVSGTLPTGMTLSTMGVISGTPTQTGTSTFTVQVNDADGETATTPLSITITGLLQGPNTFYMNGFNNNLPFYVAGSFVADGNGNITSGLLDENGTDSVGLVTNAPFTGTFSVTSNPMGNGSLGVMTLNITTPSGVVTRTYGLAFSQDGNVHLIETDTNVWASGLIQPQNLTSLSLSSLAGDYAYGFIGNDSANKRYAGAGAFNSSNPGVNGEEDSNDNGTVATNTTTVTFNTLDTTTGRGTMTVVAGSTTRNYAFYVINPLSFGLVALETDAASSTGVNLATVVPQISGSIGGGNASFGDGALSTSAVMQLNAITNNLPDESVGVATFDSKGNIARSDGAPGYYMDENQGGTLTSQTCAAGFYAVFPNGRVEVNKTGCGPQVVWYLTNNNRGFVIGQDAGVTAGIFEPQTGGGPFTQSSILPGNMLGGTVTPVLPTQTNELQSTAAFSSGVWTYTYVANGPAGVQATQTDINIGWILDPTMLPNGSTYGATLGKWDMGLVLNNAPVTTQLAYSVIAIPSMNTTQTTQRMVVLDIMTNDGLKPQTNPRLIYLEH